VSLKPTDPTGLQEVDRVNTIAVPTLADYVAGVSDYILNRHHVSNDAKKAAQIRLSNALSRHILSTLTTRLPKLRGYAGERPVAGALRTANADVSELHQLDGLRLAIEIKPVNAAVGRAIWNRFGDIRAFAVNIHLKFPFAVVGGVLTLPSWEWATSKRHGRYKKPTTDLVDRAIRRLQRAGGRLKESDAAHLMEGIWVLVYDPDTLAVDPQVPPVGSRLRYDEFIDDLVGAYEARFFD
jgi:hypothetical protein